VHAGAFEASADSHLESGFDDSRRGEAALDVGVGIADAVAVGLEVVQGPASVFEGGGSATEGGKQNIESARVEFVLPPLGPRRVARVGRSIKDFGEVAEIPFGVEPLDDIQDLGKQFVRELLNLRGP
jgi:hypothetical protein